MTMTMKSELAALVQMTPRQLRDKYMELFGEPSRSGNKDFLRKRLAWRLQSLAEGTLSERARQRAVELAHHADIRMTMPRPPQTTAGAATTTKTAPTRRDERVPIPGTELTREYKGRLITVMVLAKGFEWDGKVYRSLSAVAKAVTGSHWSGHLFFNLSNGVCDVEKA